jgi:hypothetical protein
MRTAVPELPLSNSPSREYRSHHRVEEPAIDAREFRPGWRRKSPLLCLLQTGRIGPDELEAGLAFRAWCEAVGHMRTQKLAARINQTPQPTARTQRELTAAYMLKTASAALGAKRIKLLVWCAAEDLSWVAIGKRLNIRRETATKWCAEALEELARWQAGRGRG